MRNVLLFAGTISLAGVSGYAVQHHLSTPEPVEINIPTSIGAGTIRPEFAMKDINGELRNISDWDGKIILLNFWATWCPPCLKEIPDFIELQNEFGEKGLQVVGIAVDDEALARSFAEDIGMNYPVMAADSEAIELSQRYGNQIGGLPYTVIINRKGEITDMITGELSKIKAEKILSRLGLEL